MGPLSVMGACMRVHHPCLTGSQANHRASKAPKLQGGKGPTGRAGALPSHPAHARTLPQAAPAAVRTIMHGVQGVFPSELPGEEVLGLWVHLHGIADVLGAQPPPSPEDLAQVRRGARSTERWACTGWGRLSTTMLHL